MRSGETMIGEQQQISSLKADPIPALATEGAYDEIVDVINRVMAGVAEAPDAPHLQEDDGFSPLRDVLSAALSQAQSGKGKDRHGNGKPFMLQPIMELGRMTGPSGPAFQAMKKIGESLGMVGRKEYGPAQAELLGAIVYASAVWLLIEESK